MTLATVPRYTPLRSPSVGRRAIVIGAGMAGLCAARILADGFETVTVIDRDPLPDDSQARRGVPQSNHPHVLLEAGRSVIEDVFPGFTNEVCSAGGQVVDVSSDLKMFAERAFITPGNRRLSAYYASRPVYEQLLRRRVADSDEIHIKSSCSFVDYLFDDGSNEVVGVLVRERTNAVEITADLVVDATGRTSRTPTWLTNHGYSPPPVEEVRIDLAYSTTSIERPDDDRRVYLVQPSPPLTRGGAVIPVEGDRWLVTLIGFHGDHPPTDVDGFSKFAATLPTPDVSTLLEGQPWIDEEIKQYPFPSHRRYRYEELDRFPDGLVVIGDAIASFNPVYGQGMSVAALEAILLQHALRSGGRADIGRRFFDRAASVIDVAWLMATGADFRYPQTEGPRPPGTGFFNRYMARLVRGAHTDGTLTDAFYRVIMMERPPTSLLHPRVLFHVLRPAR